MVDISFEGIDSPTYKDHKRFIQTFIDLLKEEFQFRHEK